MTYARMAGEQGPSPVGGRWSGEWAVPGSMLKLFRGGDTWFHLCLIYHQPGRKKKKLSPGTLPLAHAISVRKPVQGTGKMSLDHML